MLVNKAFFSNLFFNWIPLFLSVILHPLLMPVFGTYLILNSGTHISYLPSEAKNLILLIVASGTFVLPLAFIPLFYYRKILLVLDINQKQERIIPLIITVMLYYMTFFLLNKMGAPILIQAFVFSTTIAVVLTLFITIKWKISAHLIGIGGIIGLIIAMSLFYHVNMLFYLFLYIFLAGLIAYSRLSLNAHTPAQVYTGFWVGLITVISALFLF
jgi:hypothetical protein